MHLIQKHKMEISCFLEKTGYEIKDDISMVLEREFYPRLEKLLASYDHPDTLWQIETLPVTVSNIDPENWRIEFVQKSISNIKRYLDEHRPALVGSGDPISYNQEILQLNKAAYIQDLVVSYLKNGTLKPNLVSKDIANIFDGCELNEKMISKLKAALKHDYNTILRWTIHVPQFIKDNVLKYAKASKDQAIHLKEDQQISRADLFVTFLKWAFFFKQQQLLSDAPVPGLAKQKDELKKIGSTYFNVEEKTFNQLWQEQRKHFRELFSFPDARAKSAGVTSEDFEEQKNQRRKKEDIHYVDNAGLVLLHPFYHSLFDTLGYLEKGKWKDADRQHRAVLLLQYLTNFEEKIFENELVLNKILCGVPVRDTLLTEWKITPKEKEQCKELLKAVIGHWKVLKNTSIATLQESFLIRSAKLSQNKNSIYEITVEQKSYDLLLDRLLWGIRIIKTPWIKDYIVCNWN